jgi:hypothetical protein
MSHQKTAEEREREKGWGAKKLFAVETGKRRIAGSIGKINAREVRARPRGKRKRQK